MEDSVESKCHTILIAILLESQIPGRDVTVRKGKHVRWGVRVKRARKINASYQAQLSHRADERVVRHASL
jgi:hypothetical protein